MSQKINELLEELRKYLSFFPYHYKQQVMEIFERIVPCENKDLSLCRFLNKLEEKKTSRGILLMDYLHSFETLFFLLHVQENKEKFSKTLLDFYLVRFSDNKSFYRGKIEKVQKFLGKEVKDIPQLQNARALLKLHLGAKKIMTLFLAFFVKSKK